MTHIKQAHHPHQPDRSEQLPLTIATRGSALALWQARYVASLLAKLNTESQLNVLQTTGDKIQDRFLHEIGGKGLFIKELEIALLENRAHLAVHSAKDLPARIPEGFTLAAMLARHDPRDVLIMRPESPAAKRLQAQLNVGSGAELKRSDLSALAGTTIATASLRRTALLRSADSSINVVGVRGNVDTRLKKLREEGWDGIILAAASLERLNIEEPCHFFLEAKSFVPSPAQGILAIETCEQAPCIELLGQLECSVTRFCGDIERKLLAALGGDCTMPYAAHVRPLSLEDRSFEARAMLLEPNGQLAEYSQRFVAQHDLKAPSHTSDESGCRAQIEQTVGDLMHGLQEAGGTRILKAMDRPLPASWT